MNKRRGWKAEEWRGKINRVAFVRAKVSREDREMGLTVFEVYGDPLGYCAVCGMPLYHHWNFMREDGAVLLVGQECASVVLGQSPSSYLKDEAERHAADEAFARLEAQEVARRSWWKAPEQAALRRAVVTGLRAERLTFTVSRFYTTAWKAARIGAMSPKFREWVERASTPTAPAAVARTAKALQQLEQLRMVRASKFDAPIIRDMDERSFPLYDDRKIYGPVLSEKQAELIAKLHKRYSKQMKTVSV